LLRSQDIGRPVMTLNASPFRVATNSELRKLSAWATVRKPSFHSLPAIFQRTL
jgi:hypothetical protein